MAAIHLSANKSLTLSNKIPAGNIPGGIISVGSKGRCCYYSYLYFDTSTIPGNVALVSATLVLFRVASSLKGARQEFAIYPLLKEFSSCTTYLHDCPAGPAPGIVFSPDICDAVVEVDITTLVKKWLDNSLVNRGLAIKKLTDEAGRAFFGGARCRNRTLIPFIRVIYRQSPGYCPPAANISYSAVVIPARQ